MKYKCGYIQERDIGRARSSQRHDPPPTVTASHVLPRRLPSRLWDDIRHHHLETDPTAALCLTLYIHGPRTGEAVHLHSSRIL